MTWRPVYPQRLRALAAQLQAQTAAHPLGCACYLCDALQATREALASLNYYSPEGGNEGADNWPPGTPNDNT